MRPTTDMTDGSRREAVDMAVEARVAAPENFFSESRRKKSKPRLSHRNHDRNVHSSYYLLYDLSAIHCAAARPNAPGLTTHVPRHLRQMHTTHIATATWHPTPWPFPAPASASWRVLVLVLGSLSSLARSPSLHRRALSLFSLEFPLSSPGTNNHHATCNFSSSPVDCSSFLLVGSFSPESSVVVLASSRDFCSSSYSGIIIN